MGTNTNTHTHKQKEEEEINKRDAKTKYEQDKVLFSQKYNRSNIFHFSYDIYFNYRYVHQTVHMSAGAHKARRGSQTVWS